MQATATTKYTEALAHDIADALNAAPQSTGRVTVYFNKDANTYAVQVRINRTRYDLTMPAPGAMYGLFRRNAWIGGVNLNTDAQPVDVARSMLARISQTL